MATETRVSTEKEIASKKIQVGKKNYYVDLKQNQKGMFIKFVEVLASAKHSRIVVPMSVAVDFHEKLMEIKTFLDNYVPTDSSNVTQSADRYATTIKSAQLFVLNRRFYFDLKESPRGKLILRISLVSSTDRINVNIFAEAVSAVASIIGEFIMDHPITPAAARTGTSPKRQENGDPKVSPLPVNEEPVPEKTRRTRAKRAPKKQQQPLLVLNEPMPEVFTVEGRTYTFELVSGEDHTFVRVCEQKSFRKSTMHIPLDLCDKWMEICGSFVKSIPASVIEDAMKNKSSVVHSSS